MFAEDALALCLRIPGISTVLDVGSGSGEHAAAFKRAEKHVTTLSYTPPADIIGDYALIDFDRSFDLVWCSHVMEHQRNVGAFIDKLQRDCRPYGWIAITVPPVKPDLVGGHVALFNERTLLYNLVVAGIDCRRAKVRKRGYNISVIVQNVNFVLPKLNFDSGDIEALADWFPLPVWQNYSADIDELNWSH